jgi:hypothetical protein
LNTQTLTLTLPPPLPLLPLSYQQVLYDRAPARVHPRSAAEKHQLIRHLSEDEGVLR